MIIGQKLKGKVTGIKPYGAFLELDNGVTGLIHISEIKTGYVGNIYDELTIGQEVTVQVLDVDEYTGKSSLSMRTLEEERHHVPYRHRFTNSRCKIGFRPLGQQLDTWISDSLAELKQREQG